MSSGLAEGSEGEVISQTFAGMASQGPKFGIAKPLIAAAAPLQDGEEEEREDGEEEEEVEEVEVKKEVKKDAPRPSSTPSPAPAKPSVAPTVLSFNKYNVIRIGKEN